MEIPFRVLVSDEPVRLRPLDDPERQIRLLRIKSEPGFDEVEYEILVKNLDEFAGRYVAISYVWGEGQSSESIIIREEGRPEWTIKIGRNLSRVLAVLRYNLGHHHTFRRILNVRHRPGDTFRDQTRKDPEYFWIDALCIEQTDIQEKNHQVPLMGKIYQSAFSTYVWLGGTINEYSPSIMASLRQRFMEKARLGEGVPGMLAIAASPWWHRAWTVQEAVLSSTILFLFGEDCIPWEVLEEIMARTEKHRGEGWEYLSDYFRFGSLASPFEQLRVARDRVLRSTEFNSLNRGQNSSDIRPRLDELIWQFGDRMVKDERDKIYSMLGMAEEIVGLTVDYGKTIDEVFAETSKALVKADNPSGLPLEHIALRHGNSILEAPSWVTTWRPRLSPYCMFDTYHLGLSPFNADGGVCLQYPMLKSMVEDAAQTPSLLKLKIFMRLFSKLDRLPPRHGNIATMITGWMMEVGVDDGPSTECDRIAGFVRTVFADLGCDRRSRLPPHEIIGTLKRSSPLFPTPSTALYNQQTYPLPPSYTPRPLQHLLVQPSPPSSKVFPTPSRGSKFSPSAKIFPSPATISKSPPPAHHPHLAPFERSMSTPSAREVPYYRKWISEIRNYDGSKPFQGMDIDPFPLGVYERNQKVCYVHHLGGADCGGLCHLCLLRSQELHKSFVKRLQGWRFALTQDGTFCLVPVHAMCGDTIAIVLGMSTPLLLRPCTGGEFCVVGRCYVHGFMDGEAVDDIRQVMDDAGAKEFEGKECNNELWMRLQEEGLQELVLV